MGGLLAIVLALSGMFGDESPIEPEQIPWVLLMALWIGFFGAWYGGALGWIEGLILGVPLAAILGLFRNRGESNLSR